jgi:ABC-2 type transport system ATP-binding protein
MSQCVVSLSKLTKRFKGLIAVDSIDLEIGQGEIFGLLGPNGAGKTTIIKMLCTILNPTSGSAKVCGHDVVKDRELVRRSIGVVFQDSSSDEELTGYENMIFHARIYGMKTEGLAKRILDLLKLVELTDKKDQLVREYSGGMRRRLEIARGLLHHPTVLFLDEPTVGLDPQTRVKIWGYLLNLNAKENITIILTTHYMDEADRLCSRVGIIDHGKVIANDVPQKLKDSLQGDSITIGTDQPQKLMDALKTEQYIKRMSMHEKGLILNTDNAETKIAQIVSIAERAKVPILSITLSKPSLEDVFLHFTGRAIRAENGENFAEKVRMMRRAHGR